MIIASSGESRLKNLRAQLECCDDVIQDGCR